MGNRIQKWDLLKLFLMFCVVLGHFADVHAKENEFTQSLYLLIYTFHMPLFIFISGLFSKRMVNERKWDKIVGYLVLFFVSKVLAFTYDAIFLQRFRFFVLRESGIPWFMFALFVFATVTVYTSRFKPAYVLIFSVLLSLFAGYDEEINNLFVLSRIIVLYPFYYAGYCMDPKKLEKFSRGTIKKVCAAALIGVLIWVAFTFKELYVLRPMFVFQHPYAKLNELADFGPLIRLACYAVSVIACACFIILTPNKIGKGHIARLGQYTLSVYIFHFFVMYIIYTTFEAIGFTIEDIGEQMIWIIFPLAFLVTLLLSNKWLNSLVLKILELPTIARKTPKPQEKEKELITK